MATPEAWGPGAQNRAAPRAKPSIVDGEMLAARLRELAGGTDLPLDALEQALRAVLEATGAAAGAVCLYDTRGELLRLAAEQGLSDEGCRRLRTVRRGDALAWDMPLHGLLNRRAYLIDSAARNRYVPPLVESTSVRTIACLPMYVGSVPQGSLVLVMVAPAALHEEDVRALDQPVREFGRLIDIVRRHVSGVAVTSRDLPPDVPDAPEPRVPAASGGDAETRIATLTESLAAARRERARLAAENERLRREAPREDARLAELTAEIDRLRTRLAEAEAGAAHEHRVREELENALTQGASAGQSELREALEAARRAEATRSALLAENARLTAELQQLRRGGGDADAPPPDVATEIDRLRARLAEAEAGAAHEHRVREELESALERGTLVGQSELREAVEAGRRAEAARAALQAENARLAAELERLRSGEGSDHAAPELAAEIDRLRARLAEAEAGAAHEHRAREELEAALQRDSSSWLDELRQAREAARRAEAARGTAASETARLTAELEWARHQVDRIEPLVESLARAEEERARLAAALESLQGEQAAQGQALAARDGERAAAMERLQARLAEAEEAVARERQARERERDAAGESARDGELAEARQLLGAAETARDDALRELNLVRGNLARAESLLTGAQEEATRGRTEVARLREEELALRSQRDRVVHELEEARRRDDELGARLAERDRELESLRTERATELAQLERLAGELDRLRARVAELELERGHLAAEVEGAAAARARLEEALEQGLAEARSRTQESEGRLAERERDLEALRAERVAEAARLEELVGQTDALRARVTELEMERGRLAAEVEGAAAARARLEEALEQGLADARAREQELAARLAERDGELDTVRSEHAAAIARHDELAAETDQLRSRVAELELERGRLAAEVEGAAAARARLEEALEQRLAEARTREQELGAQLAERDRELEALRSAPPDAALESIEECAAESDAPLTPEPEPAKARPAAAAAPAGVAAPAGAAARTAAADGLAVVLDAAGRWEAQASGTNRRIALVPVNAEAVGRASELAPARVLVNLAHPRALAIATQLRAAGCTARIWGCIADAEAGHGVLLGPIEPVARPLDPNSVLALLEPHGKGSRRVLTVGEDVDAFISLRQALTRHGMSVSMVWNAKQAIDLLPMVRPHTVVLDLGLPPSDTSSMVGLLVASTPPPVSVLVAGNKDAAPAFAMALAAAVGAGAVSGLADLLRQMHAAVPS